MVVPGCLDGLHFEPSSNHLEECSWRWTIMQSPTFAVSEMHLPWHARLFAECLVFFPIVFYFTFLFYFYFLGSLMSLKEYQWRQSPSLVVLARCRSRIGLLHETWNGPSEKSPSKRTYWARQLHLTFTSNRLAQVGDVGQGVQRWSWILSNTTPDEPMETTKQTWLKCPAYFYSSKVVSSHTKNIGTWRLPSLRFTIFVLYRSTISPEENNYRLSSGVSQDKKLTSSPLSHTHPQVQLFPAIQ